MADIVPGPVSTAVLQGMLTAVVQPDGVRQSFGRRIIFIYLLCARQLYRSISRVRG